MPLDKFVFVERDRTWEIYDWLQQCTPETLAAELADADLNVACVLGDVAGAPYDPVAPEFASSRGPADSPVAILGRAITSRSSSGETQI